MNPITWRRALQAAIYPAFWLLVKLDEWNARHRGRGPAGMPEREACGYDLAQPKPEPPPINWWLLLAQCLAMFGIIALSIWLAP